MDSLWSAQTQNNLHIQRYIVIIIVLLLVFVIRLHRFQHILSFIAFIFGAVVVKTLRKTMFQWFSRLLALQQQQILDLNFRYLYHFLLASSALHSFHHQIYIFVYDFVLTTTTTSTLVACIFVFQWRKHERKLLAFHCYFFIVLFMFMLRGCSTNF